MPVTLAVVRQFALALPGTTEEPHHNFGSFRVRGKIFVTIPPGGETLHVFLADVDRDLALSMDPEFLVPVHWGSKVLGVRVALPLARKSAVLTLIQRAHAYKSAPAPARRPKAQRPPAALKLATQNGRDPT